GARGPGQGPCGSCARGCRDLHLGGCRAGARAHRGAPGRARRRRGPCDPQGAQGAQGVGLRGRGRGRRRRPGILVLLDFRRPPHGHAAPTVPTSGKEPMRTAEIRQRWLNVSHARDHAVVPSANLVSPDPSTLFTIAGMVPFIPYMLGEQTPPWKRATSVQKCVRTLDIDEVGKTTRHGTFFQMNGKFSFGDYFKEGAITYAWDLITTSQAEGGYGFDPDKIWVTVFHDDD